MCQCAALEDGGTDVTLACFNCGRAVSVSAERATHWPVLALRADLIWDSRPQVSTIEADWWPVGLTVDKQGRCRIRPVEQLGLGLAWEKAA